MGVRQTQTMASKEQRAREIQETIRDVLVHDWDPVGVGGVPEARDEYDSYVGDVYRLLVSGAGPSQVAEHLARIEQEWLGLPTAPEALIPVAQKLCALDVRLGVAEGSA